MDLLSKLRGKMQQLFSPKIISPVTDESNLMTNEGRMQQSWKSAWDDLDRQIAANKGVPVPSKAPAKAPARTQAPKKQVLASSTKRSSVSQLEKIIRQGLEKYSKGTPIATAAAYLAEAGKDLPDPYLPTIVSLLESSGGKNITRGNYNAFNLLPTREGVNYADYDQAILGGRGKQGFRGVIKSGLYDKYLNSGRLEDFFNTYSPPSENAPIEVQKRRYSELRKYFE